MKNAKISKIYDRSIHSNFNFFIKNTIIPIISFFINVHIIILQLHRQKDFHFFIFSKFSPLFYHFLIQFIYSNPELIIIFHYNILIPC